MFILFTYMAAGLGSRLIAIHIHVALAPEFKYKRTSK